MARRNTIEPRYIKAETICLGDTIKVTFPPDDDMDMERTYVGTVASRDRIPPFRTVYHTAKNAVLLHHVIGETPKYRITLLDRAELPATPQLFQLDKN